MNIKNPQIKVQLKGVLTIKKKKKSVYFGVIYKFLKKQ